MKKRFQLLVSLSVLSLLLIGFFSYSIWVKKIVYNNLKEQALQDNLTIGESIFGMLEKTGANNSDTDLFIRMIQETSDVMKLPNKGYICMVDSTGNLLAAPGLKGDEKINLTNSSFTTSDESRKLSFDDFYELDLFNGYYKSKRLNNLDIIVGMKHKFTGYKLLIHQNAQIIKQKAKSKSMPLFWVGIGFALILSALAYYIINKQVKTYQLKIYDQNLALTQINIEIKEKNKVLRKKNEQLEELADEKDGLLSIMAHDLKNPLGGMESVVSLVENAGKLNKKQEEYFSLLEQQVKSARNLIHDVLEMNKLENDTADLKKDAIDLVDFLVSKKKSFEPIASKKDIELNCICKEDSLWLTTGVNELNRIVDNLLSNSIKYSPIGKTVNIQLEKNTNAIALHFIDKGKGIPEKEMPKLFRKFSKLSTRPTNEESSTGLGLYIVKVLAGRIDANIDVKSEVGIGSCFSLLIPTSTGSI
jgi:signal transduction histidine kinase